jgi:hypothetical protein
MVSSLDKQVYTGAIIPLNLKDLYYGVRNLFRGNQNEYVLPEIPIAKNGFNTTRGLMASEDLELVYTFQFNPTEIMETMQQQYEEDSKLGAASQESVWLYNNPVKISFQLFLDATQSTNLKMYGGTTRDNKALSDDRYSFTQSKLSDPAGAARGEGLIPVINTLRSFRQPKPINRPVAFAVDGQLLSNNRFVPPPRVIFTYGDFYMKGKVTNMDFRTTLFNEALNPVRTTCDIELTVNLLRTVSVAEKTQIDDFKNKSFYSAIPTNMTPNLGDNPVYTGNPESFQ